MSSIPSNAPALPQLDRRLLAWFARRRWSEADYLVFANDQSALIELGDGKMVLHEMPTPRHQAVVVALVRALGGSSLGHVYVAPMPIRLWADKMREPDVVFYRSEHMDRIHEQFADPPDLVVEVLSPSTRAIDEVEKLAEYTAAGIPEYWVVDAEAGAIDVRVLAGDRYGPVRRHVRGDVLSPGPAADISVEVDEVVGPLST